MTNKDFEDAAQETAIAALEGLAELIRKGNPDTQGHEWRFYKEVMLLSIERYEFKQIEEAK